MLNNRILVLITLILVFGCAVASSQVKLAEVAGGPAPGAFNALTGFAFGATGAIGYIANSGSGLVQKFSTTSGKILQTLQLPAELGAMALSRDERWLVVACISNQKLYIIDTVSMTLWSETSYPSYLPPQQTGFTSRNNIVISQDGSRIFIADPDNDRVVVFNTRDGSFDRFIRFIATGHTGIHPNMITLAPDGHTAAVLCSDPEYPQGQSVWLLDTGTSIVSLACELPEDRYQTQPFNNIQFNGLPLRQLYVASYGSDRIAVCDLRTFQLGGYSSPGRGPTYIKMSPRGGQMAVINAKDKTVAVLNIPEMTLQQKVEIPGVDFSNDSNVEFSPDGGTLFIPSLSRGEIIAYNLNTMSIKRRVAVGQGPTTVGVTPDGTVLASIDVTSNVMSLIAISPIAYLIPHLAQTPKDYSGIAVANFGDDWANVALLAYTDTGALIRGTHNPRLFTIGPHQQISQLVYEIFGFDPNSTLDGYVEGYTLGAQVAILYSTGNNEQTQLDGFAADAITSRRLGFPRITERVSKFGSQTSTEIILLNPNEEAAYLDLSLFARTPSDPASLIGAITGMVLPGHHRVRSRISQLIPTGWYPLDNAYLAVDSVKSDMPIKALEVVRIGDSIAIVQGVARGLDVRPLIAAQFASAGAGVLNTPIFSDLDLANSNPNEEITVTIGAVGAEKVVDPHKDPIPINRRPIVRTLAPYEAMTIRADEFFGVADPLTNPDLYRCTLELKVEEERKGLVASMLFGDARSGRYLTSQSPHAQPGRKFALGHFAEGYFGSPKPCYTGIAVYNPNFGDATAIIDAYAPNGKLIDTRAITVTRQSRISKTVGEIFSRTEMGSGTLVITSNVPIYLYAVFGTQNADFLAAVQPMILEQ